MLAEKDVKQKNTPTGIYLSAETEKGKYGQAYNLTKKGAANYVGNVFMARRRFVAFYNQFE